MLVNGKRQTSRKVDVDPYFDNTKLMLGEAGSKVPYTPQNTWKDPNGDRQDYLERTKGMTTMQRVSRGRFDGGEPAICIIFDRSKLTCYRAADRMV